MRLLVLAVTIGLFGSGAAAAATAPFATSSRMPASIFPDVKFESQDKATTSVAERNYFQAPPQSRFGNLPPPCEVARRLAQYRPRAPICD